MKKIKFEIKLSGAPHPNECWWRIKGSNGRILLASELMSKRNAKNVIERIIKVIKSNQYSIVEVKPGINDEPMCR